MKKKRSPLFYLLLLLIQLLVDFLLVIAGPMLDSAIFSHGPDTIGHGIPIFTVLFPLVAMAATLVVVIVAAVGLIRILIHRSNDRKNGE